MVKTKANSDERKAIIEKVLTNMIEGMSLRKSCLASGTTAQSFIRWCDDDKSLSERYAHAREAMIDKMADELLDIADTPAKTNENGSIDNGAVQEKRLQIDTRKWVLSKIAPKKYGDKLEVSGDSGSPLVHRIERVVINNE